MKNLSNVGEPLIHGSTTKTNPLLFCFLQLTPIERYAMNFLEASLEDVCKEELKQAEVTTTQPLYHTH